MTVCFERHPIRFGGDRQAFVEGEAGGGFVRISGGMLPILALRAIYVLSTSIGLFYVGGCVSRQVKERSLFSLHSRVCYDIFF